MLGCPPSNGVEEAKLKHYTFSNAGGMRTGGLAPEIESGILSDTYFTKSEAVR
jgi:hypothetical protein